jgi:hypothetical protein
MKVFGAKASLLCGGAHAVSKLLAWEEHIPLGSLLHHWITSILDRWHICDTKALKPATAHQPGLKDISM